MGDMVEIPNEDDIKHHYIWLTKDGKPICRTQCSNPPLQLPRRLSLHSITPRTEIHCLPSLPPCLLRPAAECSRDQREWVRFLSYLQTRDMVAIAKFEFSEFYILPPDDGLNFSHVRVAYQIKKGYNVQRHCESVPDTSMHASESCGFVQPRMVPTKTCMNDSSPDPKFPRAVGDHHAHASTGENCSKPQPCGVKPDGPLEKNYVRADPSYLQTLSQAHYAWIFGAIAELIDNSRDAKATKLDISIEMIYSKKDSKHIPMLSVIDDGHGMTHPEVVRMMYLGHKQPDADDPDHIGRFGVGFKNGAMRLGRDALVLTQSVDSRSIASLSQSLNEGKDNLEIPIVSYRRKGQFMEVDTSVQSEALAKYNLKAIKEFSPFDKYFIGGKAGLFLENHTGTQIYIWNLDKWGSDYCLEWHTGLSGGSSFHQGDILIRSRRTRSRPGQMSQKVPLDYSLRSYLEVIFLDPRMRINVQGSMVKSRPLAKFLSKTCVETGDVMGKPVHLTLGRCQLEWERANSGIFLYWHGRLIEAYKRVGGMIHNGDMGRGVIGVIDVTDLMVGKDGSVWVHSNKQAFQDCVPYVELEKWLGTKADEYWDKNFDTLQLKKAGALHKPDHEWVQCDKCRKWRMLTPGFDSKNLPPDWFCYMKPFNGSCETPEQEDDPGVITVSAKRSGYDSKEKPVFKDDVNDATSRSDGGEKKMSYGVASVEKNGGNLANMRLAFSADAGTAAVYKPLMPATDTTTTITDTHAGNFHQQPPSGVVSGMKRKRGRPRKYAPDADADGGVTMALHLLAPSQLPQQPITSTASVPTKKGRGRPPGSARKQHPSPSTYALGSARVGFTPHVITVQAGEDVLAKIMSFSQNGPRTVCILSANGTISNVTLRHAATSGGTVTYEGRFEILSLSGSFLLSETGGQRSRTGGLSVSLAGPDGRVLGGGVAGLFTAASPVQVVVGSFIAEGQKESKSGNQSEPLSAPAKLVPGTLKAGSPPSRGTLSESSGGPASPLNQSAGGCNNSNPQGLGNMPWK